MAVMIRPIKRNFLRPKVFLPVAVLLWLLVSIPLYLLIPSAQAHNPSDDSGCNPPTPSGGDDGQYALMGVQSPGKLKPVYDNCYHVSGTLVYMEWWRGCVKWGWSTCSSTRDGDFNYYLVLDEDISPYNPTPTEIKNLRRYRQAQRTANFLAETIPCDHTGPTGRKNTCGTITGDGDPDPLKGTLAPPCMDSDLNYSDGVPRDAQAAGIGPCKGKNVKIAFTGTLAYDTAHGYKEVHPIKIHDPQGTLVRYP